MKISDVNKLVQKYFAEFIKLPFIKVLNTTDTNTLVFKLPTDDPTYGEWLMEYL